MLGQLERAGVATERTSGAAGTTSADEQAKRPRSASRQRSIRLENAVEERARASSQLASSRKAWLACGDRALETCFRSSTLF